MAFRGAGPSFCGPCGALLPRAGAADGALHCLRCGTSKKVDGKEQVTATCLFCVSVAVSLSPVFSSLALSLFLCVLHPISLFPFVCDHLAVSSHMLCMCLYRSILPLSRCILSSLSPSLCLASLALVSSSLFAAFCPSLAYSRSGSLYLDSRFSAHLPRNTFARLCLAPCYSPAYTTLLYFVFGRLRFSLLIFFSPHPFSSTPSLARRDARIAEPRVRVSKTQV